MLQTPARVSSFSWLAMQLTQHKGAKSQPHQTTLLLYSVSNCTVSWLLWWCHVSLMHTLSNEALKNIFLKCWPYSIFIYSNKKLLLELVAFKVKYQTLACISLGRQKWFQRCTVCFHGAGFLGRALKCNVLSVSCGVSYLAEFQSSKWVEASM